MKISIVGCLAAFSALAVAFPTAHIARRQDNSTAVAPPPGRVNHSIVNDCIKYHVADYGDYCEKIGLQYGLQTSRLSVWNDMSQFGGSCYVKVGEAYCVMTASFAAAVPKDCTNWHVAESGDNCYDLGRAANPPVSEKQIAAWNQLGDYCSMQFGISYCLMTASYAPGPADCTKWHVAQVGDNCYDLGRASEPLVSEEQIAEWNGLGDYCGFQPGLSYCLMTASYVPEPLDGPADCNKWHKVIGSGFVTDGNSTKYVSGDNCPDLVEKYGIDLPTFYEWNPSVNSPNTNTTCTRLIAGQSYCVGTDSYVPPPPSPAPGPVQEGQPADCNDWRYVHQNTTCNVLAHDTGVDVPTLVELNPAVGAECTNMWYGYYVCVGTESGKGTGAIGAPTKPTKPTTGKPTKPNKETKPTKPNQKPDTGKPAGKPSSPAHAGPGNAGPTPVTVTVTTPCPEPTSK